MNSATPSEAVTDTRDEQTKQSSSVPLVTIIVAILAGVSGLLLLLLIGFFALLSGFAFYKKHKKNLVNTQYDMPMGLSILERRNRSYNSRLQQQLPDLPPINIYSEIKDGNKVDLFHQTIDESMPQQGGNEHKSVVQKVPTFQAVSLRTQSKDSEENVAECDYTDMTGSRDPSLSPACSQTSLPDTAGPVLLSKSMWHNKIYNSSWSLLLFF